MLSQLFVLSPRGDSIVKREFRHDVPGHAPEIFFRAVRFWKDGEKAPAVFNENGVNYLHVKVRLLGVKDRPRARASLLIVNSRASSTPPELPPPPPPPLSRQAGGLYYVATTRQNVSPSFVLELLHRVARVARDYLGVADEDAMRKNAVLVYELVDEMLDRGFAQDTTTESLKAHVFNEPVAASHPRVDADGRPAGATGMTPTKGHHTPGRGSVGAAYGRFFGGGLSGQSGGGGAGVSGGPLGGASARSGPRADVTRRSVIAKGAGSGGDRNEIFVDVVERLNVTFNASGALSTAEIDGVVTVRNFLVGSPAVTVAFPEDLVVGGRDFSAFRGGGSGPSASRGSAFTSGSAAVFLDDCNFHESADLSAFDTDRLVRLETVPRGEFALMHYRASDDFNPPFKVTTLIDESVPYKIFVTLRVKADFSRKLHCAGLAVKFPVGGGKGAGASGSGADASSTASGSSHTAVSSSPVAAVTATLERDVAPGTQFAAYDAAERHVVWQFKRVKGGGEHSLRIAISLREERSADARKACGPVHLGFTVPGLNASRVQVRYLQIDPPGDATTRRRASASGAGGGKGEGPHRWVRYVTKSSNFVARV